MRGLALVLVLVVCGCAGIPAEPEAVVAAALDAARDGDLDGFLEYYTPEAARDIKRAVAASEGSGWVPEAPLRLLTPGVAVEAHRDGDLVVVEIRAHEATTWICLARTEQGWRITTDEAINDGEGWVCRPHRTIYARTFGEDDAAEE